MSQRTPITPARSEFIDAAIRIDNVCLNYRIEMCPSAALEFIRGTKGYNGFTSEDLSTLILRIGEEVPRMDYGPENPNTGGPTHSFMIGNEYSRVIYLNLDVYPLKRRRGEPVDLDLLRARLETLASLAHADEIDWTEQGEHRWTLRIWWD